MRPFDPAQVAKYPAVIGCDEVGRGALCGPVMVAAIWFNPLLFPPHLLARLDDSKRLDRATRKALTPLIRAHAQVALAAASCGLVDRINVRAATLDAMRRAVTRLGVDAPVLVDGRDIVPGLPLPCRAVVGGDRKIPQIAAASIVAKTCRDEVMRRLSLRHPAYAWERNAGYGTAAHLAGLTAQGRSPHHRVSFTRRF
ncbi:ribonuclease HII [Methylobacterium gnaphalii]|uniref:Ribonuclease n=1 Tax=Methylobacterium gnaphalii TaxID=1010610 RepID=A0A512JQU7_9HYPH|nr:ribonuclease HII [Methylobacterium gnaphalii]GEP12336.1 ribonuclease HII [Methylobacterium gnaphalii]GJD69093.1 Ribonuclease HII [Methylobacterium gnaphalii]GLS48546.1 ribonuclease HII [Methylobacterium gnaphalii]